MSEHPLTPEMVFDMLAIQINGPKAWNQQINIDVVLTDTVTDTSPATCYHLWLSNGALIHSVAKCSRSVDVTLIATVSVLSTMVVHGLRPEALKKAGIQVVGDHNALDRLAVLLDSGDPRFNIVTP
jgi:alkyl sulfatase BDS1-like metallo-beta-lactamase superfamily hydrolase